MRETYFATMELRQETGILQPRIHNVLPARRVEGSGPTLNSVSTALRVLPPHVLGQGINLFSIQTCNQNAKLHMLF